MKPPHAQFDSTADAAGQLHRSAMRLIRLLRAPRSVNALSLSKLSVLSRLYQNGATTATELAAFLSIQPQSLTRLIAELERNAYITRRPNEADRRQNLLEITKAGLDLLTEEIRQQRVILAQAIATELSVAERDLLRIAAGLMDRLSEAAEKLIADSAVKRDPEFRAGRFGG